MNWRFWRRDGRAAAQQRELEANARLRAAQRMTRHVENMAPAIANLPPDEFAERVARAFRGWA